MIALLSKPKGWAQYSLARDGLNAAVVPESKDAVAELISVHLCLPFGAMWRASETTHQPQHLARLKS